MHILFALVASALLFVACNTPPTPAAPQPGASAVTNQPGIQATTEFTALAGQNMTDRTANSVAANNPVPALQTSPNAQPTTVPPTAQPSPTPQPTQPAPTAQPSPTTQPTAQPSPTVQPTVQMVTQTT